MAELEGEDGISFVGRFFFSRMHVRVRQAKRPFFIEADLDPNDYILFGDISMILVGDFDQLDPTDFWGRCDCIHRQPCAVGISQCFF